MRDDKIVEQGYNKIAVRYADQRDLFKNDDEFNEFVTLLPESGLVLDVGCGAGIPIAHTLLKKGFKVIGIDISEEMLTLAKRNVPEAQFLEQNMRNLTFKVNQFAGIIACYSIFHIPREEHSLLFHSFFNLLKPNGLILVSMGSNEWEGIEEFHGAQMFWSHYDSELSLNLIKQARFHILFDRHVTSGDETHYWVLAQKK